MRLLHVRPFSVLRSGIWGFGLRLKANLIYEGELPECKGNPTRNVDANDLSKEVVWKVAVDQSTHRHVFRCRLDSFVSFLPPS